MEQELKDTLEVLRKGGVILYPTDTVWGLGCDASNPQAVARVFSIKRRSDAKALRRILADAGPEQAMLAVLNKMRKVRTNPEFLLSLDLKNL